MSVWTMHNSVRYALVFSDGRTVLFEFSKGGYLDTHSGVVDEIRPGLSYEYYYGGHRIEELAGRWAGEIAGLVSEHGRGDGVGSGPDRRTGIQGAAGEMR